MGVTFSNFSGNPASSTCRYAYSQQQRTGEALAVQKLANDDQPEVLSFLSRRPIHTVCMAGYILDHGVVSSLNRGTFYGCRGEDGSLQGVALIGHATLLEVQSDEALKAFATLKDEYAAARFFRGEELMIGRFWREYAGRELERLASRELLFEHVTGPIIDGPVPDLQPATPADLETVMNINADLLQAECGVNPIDQDLEGFRTRILRRIEQGRIWTWTRKKQLLFKADVFAQTPEMTYLEGVYVHPSCRRQGNGVRCMAQLSRLLLQRSQSICLLINERNSGLENFYHKAGYRFRGRYHTIYLQRKAS